MQRDQGFNDLLKELTALITGILNEIMKEEIVERKLNDINRKMWVKYGCVVGAIVLNIEFVTTPLPCGRGTRKPEPSIKFQFGVSREDKEMGGKLGLNEGEMNDLLEEARLERDRASPPDMGQGGERSGPIDPRSIEQIMNSMEKIAEMLNFNQRQFLIGLIKESKTLGFYADIEGIRAGDNKAWFEWVRGLFDTVRSFMGSENQAREVLLALERLFRVAQVFRRV